MLKLAKLITLVCLTSIHISALAGESDNSTPEKTLVQHVWSEDFTELEKKLETISKNNLYHARCSMGLTILHHAAVVANIPMLELIAKTWVHHGLNLDELAGRKGSTPAHSALQLLSQKTPEVLRTLKNSGATCDIQRGIDMKTPLQVVEMEIAARMAKLSTNPANEDLLKQLKSEIEVLKHSKAVLDLEQE